MVRPLVDGDGLKPVAVVSVVGGFDGISRGYLFGCARSRVHEVVVNDVVGAVVERVGRASQLNAVDPGGDNIPLARLRVVDWLGNGGWFVLVSYGL